MKKILMIAVFLLVAGAGFAQPQQRPANNTLSDREKTEGWILLFDGEKFDGWRQYNGQAMPQQWSIDEGSQAMRLETNAKRPGSGQGADIIFAARKFDNFELSIDWMVEKRGNSGIFYYVVEQEGQAVYASAPEIQVLDNTYAGDNALTNHLAGSLYDMVPALPINAAEHGNWNNVVIRVDNGTVTHTQNGIKVCEYTLWTPEWYRMVERSKFKDWPGFKNGPDKTGYIGLQDHGFGVWFRNIKIRELK